MDFNWAQIELLNWAIVEPPLWPSSASWYLGLGDAMWPSKISFMLGCEPGERQTAVRIIFRQPFGNFELYMWNCDAIPGCAQSGLDLWRSIFSQQENRRARTRARLLNIFCQTFRIVYVGNLWIIRFRSGARVACQDAIQSCLHAWLHNHLLIKSLWICVLHLTWDLIVYVGPEGFLLSDIHTYIHTYTHLYIHTSIHTYIREQSI